VPRGPLTSKPTCSNASGCSDTSVFFFARVFWALAGLVFAQGRKIMDTIWIVVVVLVVLFLFGGGGGYYYSRRAR
jgi:hypothetical protein